MVFRKVLVVLCEELAVLKRDDTAVDGVKLRAGIGYGTYFSANTIAFNPVSYLDTTGHQRNAIIDILEDVFHGKAHTGDRKSTRLNSSHANISYAVFCLKKKTLTFR